MSMQSSDFQSEVHALTEKFRLAFGQNDAARVADFYSDSGMLLPAGMDFVKGKRDIQAFWQMAMDMGIKNAKLDILELEQHGDTAIELSNYTLSDADNQMIEYGKGIVIWKNENGDWKIHRDIWTSNETET